MKALLLWACLCAGVQSLAFAGGEKQIDERYLNRLGINNVTDSTCFLNASLKLLNTHPEIETILDPTKHPLQSQIENQDALASRINVQTALGDLIQKLKRANEGAFTSPNGFRVETELLIKHLRTFLRHRNQDGGDWFTKDFFNGDERSTYLGRDQQDAGEFLNQLLDILDYHRISKLHTVQRIQFEDKLNRWQRNAREELVSQPLNLLQITAPQNPTTLQQLVAEVSQPEIVELRNEFTGQSEEAEKAIFLTFGNEGPPQQMIIQLNRFESRYGDNGVETHKIRTKVSFSPYLSIPFLNEAQIEDDFEDKIAEQKNTQMMNYQLVSVVVHVSKSANSGHYVTYQFDEFQNKWFLHNDSKVTLVSEETALQAIERDGYLFFYSFGQPEGDQESATDLGEGTLE